MKYPGFIVLDIETTGFDPSKDDAIEVAAVKLDAKGQETDRLDILLSSKTPLSALVVALTGITPEMIAQSPYLDEVKGQIESFVGDLPIVGHNINFDVDFLTAKGINIPGDRLDTLELAQTLLPAQPGYSLEQLSYHWTFPNQPSHRAIADVLATVDLFTLLVNQVKSFKPDANAEVAKLLQPHDWVWKWLWEEDLAQFNSFTKLKNHPLPYTDYLLSEIKSNPSYAEEIKTAAIGEINVIESHLPQDQLAQTLAYAATSTPAILMVPGTLLRQLNWPKLSDALKVPFRLVNQMVQQYRPGLPQEVLNDASEVTPSLLRLATKLIYWNSEWNRAAEALYLTSEEQYEWEQKFVDSTTDMSLALDSEGVWVTTTENLSRISNLGDFELISAHPHYLEESFFDAQTRTFSVPYFNAAISSRRDFLHREVAVPHPKVADELFKVLSQVGPKFGKISEILSQIYADNPPTNVFEKDIDLTREIATSELETNLLEAIRFLNIYIEKLGEIGFDNTNQQIIRTQKLVTHLAAFAHFDSEYKYFLFAEPNKFYLQIIPGLSTFTSIQNLFSSARKVTVISPGMMFNGSFAYWQYLLPQANGKLITSNVNTPVITTVSDVNSEDNYQDLLRILEKGLEAKRNILVVNGSPYDARILFEELHKALPEYASTIQSLDTIGLADKLKTSIAGDASVLVVPLYWLERAASNLSVFDLVVIGKIAFEAGGKPIAKLYRGDKTSFGAYTLPKTTLRLKEHLHHLVNFTGPIVLMDPRLTYKDYGKEIQGSLTGWEIAPLPLADVITKI